jgi:phage tail-like protein
MPGVGANPVGFFSMGSVAGLDLNRSLGEFNFQVNARSEGFAISVTLDIPGLLEASDWNRSIKVLRKVGEWPQSHDDADATIILEHTYAGEGGISVQVDNTDLVPLKTYYYCLYEQRNDLVWIHDAAACRGWAYPYDRWGFGDYLFSSLPRGWQRADESHDLYNFCQILGAIFDDLKTDAEHLSSFFEIETINDDLIQYLDAKIAWPTWHQAGGSKRRVETSRAVDSYKLVGTRPGIESMLEDASTWAATVYEGWKYVMFTNGLYGCTTPDTTNPNYVSNIGKITDLYKYTNDSTTDRSWHSVNGFVLDLEYIPGVSSAFTSAIESRVDELLASFKTCYSNVDYIVEPVPN